MTSDELRQLDRQGLAAYLRKRLRGEPPIDPPIDWTRRQEPPEEFVLEAVPVGDAAFRERLLYAIRENLRTLVGHAMGEELPWDPADATTDQQIASLAFLVSSLEAAELVPSLAQFALQWLDSACTGDAAVTDGQFHVLRTMAQLQSDARLGSVWRDLWENGPTGLRGLAIFGWANAEPGAALSHLPELLELEPDVDVNGALWSLVTESGPGINAVADALEHLPPQIRQDIADRLEHDGADAAVLAPLAPTPGALLPWLDARVPPRPDPEYHRLPRWGRIAA